MSGAHGPWREPGAVLLVSCYELGRQPFNLASPWAQLEALGFGVDGVDTAIDELDDHALARARLVAISVPMHTATRLGIAVAKRVRRVAPNAHICFYGMYAALNAARLLADAGDSVIGGEFEEALSRLALELARSPDTSGRSGLERPVLGVVQAKGQRDHDQDWTAPPVLRKLPFVVPRRDKLAPLSRYATFFGPEPHELRKVGYVEASRGCLHTCRHCPVTPVYRGRFFVVPTDIVLADAEQQIAQGATHITFGDPDFFNGPRHGLALIEALHHRHPELSFDVTIKIEHLVEHREHVAALGRNGVALVVSAVESLSDTVLRELDKGHCRADIESALAICRAAGLALRPSFVAFTPWTTLHDYVELCDWIAEEDLVDHTDPIQLAIRLLVPPGSALLSSPRAPWLGALDRDELGYVWTHPDPRMDELYREVVRIVEQGQKDDPGQTFLRILDAAHASAGTKVPPLALTRKFVPRLSEAWFCCAEPTTSQFAQLGKRQG